MGMLLDVYKINYLWSYSAFVNVKDHPRGLQMAEVAVDPQPAFY
jgi:hypothetical protein